MAVTAEAVKALRERTGAGMMECKKALVETNGDLEAAAEIMRKSGLAKADKKASRVAAEGVVVIERSRRRQAGRDRRGQLARPISSRARRLPGLRRGAWPRLRLRSRSADLEALLAARLASGQTVEETRRALIARIGENIGVRRFELVELGRAAGTYLHGTRIGCVVAMTGGDEELGKDIAMHIAAINPQFLSPRRRAGRRRSPRSATFSSRRSRRIRRPPASRREIIAKMVDGKVRKFLGEITLLGQPFVKDDKQPSAKC